MLNLQTYIMFINCIKGDIPLRIEILKNHKKKMILRECV